MRSRPIRFHRAGRSSLEPAGRAALRARDPQRRGDGRRRRRALRRDRPSHRPLAEGQAHGCRCADGKHRLVGRQPQADARSSSRPCYQDFLAHAKGKTLFAQDLYGGADPKYRIKTRVYTELAWHSLFIRQLLIRPERSELASFVPEHDHHRHADVQARRQAPRRPRRLGHDGRHRFHPQDRADLRLVLRGRNEEVGVHHAELLSAGAGRDADALLGQRRQGRRQRAVLRPLRHRQDHALGRSRIAP